MADWGILQPPNFAAAALGGYQAGAALGKQRRTDAALQGLDFHKPETALALVAADPERGAPVLSAMLKLADAKRQAEVGAALGKVASDYFGSGVLSGGVASAPPSASAPSAPSPPAIITAPTPPNPLAAAQSPDTGAAPPPVPNAQPDAAPGSDQADIVVTAKPQAPIQANHPSMGQTVAHLLQAGVPLEQATQFVNLAGTMSKAQKDALTDQQDALGAVATSIPKGASLPERTAWVQQHRAYLLAHNVPAAQIDAFVPTDDNINAVQVTAIGVKEALTMQHQAQVSAESARHNRVEEGQGSARIGLEAQNVGISAGHLALDRQKEGREAKKQAGGVSAMSTDDLLALARGKH